VLWAIYGYSLAFAPGNPLVGGFDFLFLRGVGGAPNAAYAATIPHQTFMAFQMMFVIITPALISGAFAERIRFSGMLAFSALWITLVYLPVAHMVWGQGGLLNAFLGGALPCLDFAGGTVVHITSGVSALVCALYLKPRRGYRTEPMRPHNLVLSAAGACLLWVGWFGFNAGSALAAGSLAASAFVATHLAAAAATLGWLGVEWRRTGQPSMLGAISGAVAGLVAVTPAAGFVGPMPALVIGFAAGAFCYYLVTVVKHRFGYDDALDAFGIHGAGGTLGALLTGVFASSAINPAFSGKPAGWVDGNPAQVAYQAAGVLIAALWAAAASAAILRICDAMFGLRAAPGEEIEGLDVSMHGEEGYNFES
jgi:Amt family ammonium transporter